MGQHQGVDLLVYRFVTFRGFDHFAFVEQEGVDAICVRTHDPYVPMIRLTREHPHWAGAKSITWSRNEIESYDLVLIATNHQVVNYAELAECATCIVDTRNAMANVTTKPGQVWKA